MSLINPAILFGLGLAVIPVLLHFLMKAKPKKLVFPALQLIRNRRKTNSQRMRLKHFWLLLLRVGLIALMVIALTRPSLPPANYGLIFREWATLLGIIGVAAAVYWWLQRKWKQDQVSVAALSQRTNVARTASILSAIALALLLVLWPYSRRVAAEASSPNQSVAQDLPVSAVFLFDVSPSMGYQFESQSRLEVAQSIARRHLEALPQRSRIAVGSNANSEVVFQADLMSAQSRIEDLEITPITRPFNERLRTAIDVQQADRERTMNADSGERDQFVREIYVFTDLTRPAWNLQVSEKLRQLVADSDWMHIYLIDVGIENPINTSVKQIKLSRQSISEGGQLLIDATISSVGRAGVDQAVQVMVTTANGDSVKEGQAVVRVDGTDTIVSFPLQGLTGPIRQGEVRLESSDPLQADDVQYFTVSVAPATRVLIVGESKSETDYWDKALESVPLIRNGGAKYETTYRSVGTLTPKILSTTDIVCLVNPRRPTERTWKQLTEFVKRGGGLLVFAGSKDIDSAAWGTPAAGELLPAAMLGPIKFFKGPQQLQVNNAEHPMLRRLVDTPDGTSLFATVDFFQCWSVDPVPDAQVIATYSNDYQSPAFVERIVGEGRVVMFTNAIDFLQKGGSKWSDLAESLAFLVMADSTMQYLGRQSEDVFNYIAGQSVLVRMDLEDPFERYLVRKPGFQQLPGDVPTDTNLLTLRDNEQLGHYEVVSVDHEPIFRSGFSVNLPVAESDLTRLGKMELDGLLGDDRSYSVAAKVEELDRVVSDRRVGREVFPILLLLAIVFFCGEHFVANWFYAEQQEPVAA